MHRAPSGDRPPFRVGKSKNKKRKGKLSKKEVKEQKGKKAKNKT
jgi:hypothetical protein